MTRRKSMIPREPNGKPQRPPKEPTASPTASARLKHAALRRMADPVWGTMLGILHLSGRLNEAQRSAAGRYWSELARDYTIATSSPKYPCSVDLEPRGGTPPVRIPIVEWGRPGKPSRTPAPFIAISPAAPNLNSRPMR